MRAWIASGCGHRPGCRRGEVVKLAFGFTVKSPPSPTTIPSEPGTDAAPPHPPPGAASGLHAGRAFGVLRRAAGKTLPSGGNTPSRGAPHRHPTNPDRGRLPQQPFLVIHCQPSGCRPVYIPYRSDDSLVSPRAAAAIVADLLAPRRAGGRSLKMLALPDGATARGGGASWRLATSILAARDLRALDLGRAGCTRRVLHAAGSRCATLRLAALRDAPPTPAGVAAAASSLAAVAVGGAVVDLTLDLPPRHFHLRSVLRTLAGCRLKG